jgi:hypothetical protein
MGNDELNVDHIIQTILRWEGMGKYLGKSHRDRHVRECLERSYIHTEMEGMCGYCWVPGESGTPVNKQANVTNVGLSIDNG